MEQDQSSLPRIMPRTSLARTTILAGEIRMLLVERATITNMIGVRIDAIAEISPLAGCQDRCSMCRLAVSLSLQGEFFSSFEISGSRLGALGQWGLGCWHRCLIISKRFGSDLQCFWDDFVRDFIQSKTPHAGEPPPDHIVARSPPFNPM